MFRRIGLLIAIIGVYSTTWAEPSSSLQPITQNGNLAYILITIDDTQIKIDGYGKILNVSSAKSPNKNELNYAANGETTINDIPLRFYPCQQESMGGSVNYGNTQTIQQIQQQILGGQGNQCPNGNNGAVSTVGPFDFIYYANSSNDLFQINNDNVGKIQKAGNYYFTYYPADALENKGGKIQSMEQAS